MHDRTQSYTSTGQHSPVQSFTWRTKVTLWTVNTDGCCEQTSLNRGGGLPHHLSATYNAVFRSLDPRHTHLAWGEIGVGHMMGQSLTVVSSFTPADGNDPLIFFTSWLMWWCTWSIVGWRPPPKDTWECPLCFYSSRSFLDEWWNVFINLRKSSCFLFQAPKTIMNWMTKSQHKLLLCSLSN